MNQMSDLNKFIEQNREQLRKVFLEEQGKLKTLRATKARGEDYRARYLEDLYAKFENELSRQFARKDRSLDYPPLLKIGGVIKYGFWSFVCKVKIDNPNEGEPRQEIKDFFNSGELGSQIIDINYFNIFLLQLERHGIHSQPG